MRKHIEKEARQLRRQGGETTSMITSRHPSRYPENRTRLKPPFFVLRTDDDDVIATTRAPDINAEPHKSSRTDGDATVEPPPSHAEEPDSAPRSSKSSSSRSNADSSSRTARSSQNQWSARSEDLLETVRSTWETARVERKLKNLMDEKASILERIAKVDKALRLADGDKMIDNRYRRQGRAL